MKLFVLYACTNGRNGECGGVYRSGILTVALINGYSISLSRRVLWRVFVLCSLFSYGAAHI